MAVISSLLLQLIATMPTFLFLLLLRGAAAQATQIRQHCVLLPNSTEECHDVPSLSPALRLGKAPCLKMDKPCWSLKAMEYTNEIRQKFKVRRMLVPGTFRQLDNAVKYARILNRKGRLRHQNLRRVTREVQCKRWVGGENVAYNYAKGDVAKTCIMQWLYSERHRKNLVRPWFREVVIGFHYGSGGRVYCVQTFALIHQYGTFGQLRGRRCRRVFDKRLGGWEKPTRGKRKLTPRSRDEGNRSCRCLEVGKRCWFSLRELSGNRCRPFLPAARQPKRCKWKCCQYCWFYSTNPVCRSSSVRRICYNSK